MTCLGSTIPKPEQNLHFNQGPKENSIFKRKRASSTSSEPIKCPESSYKEEADWLQSYHRDVRYYDSLTWAMYHRITQARRKKKNVNDITHQEASVSASNINSNRALDNSIPTENQLDSHQTPEEDIFPFDM
jgi:hypothetical protein